MSAQYPKPFLISAHRRITSLVCSESFSKLVLKYYIAARRALQTSMNQHPLVSIIIPTYNRCEILINRTLPSVLGQSYQKLEVIIVSDGSTDNTVEMVNQLRDPRVRLITLKSRSVLPSEYSLRWFVQGARPRNIGQWKSKGEWLVHISDDDILYKDHVAQLLEHAQKTKADLISASYDTIKHGTKVRINPMEIDGPGSPMIGGMQTWFMRAYLKCFIWNQYSYCNACNKPIDYDMQNRMYLSNIVFSSFERALFFSPPVGSTNDSGYSAYMLAAEGELQ